MMLRLVDGTSRLLQAVVLDSVLSELFCGDVNVLKIRATRDSTHLPRVAL